MKRSKTQRKTLKTNRTTQSMAPYSAADISWPVNRPTTRGTWDPNNHSPILPQDPPDYPFRSPDTPESPTANGNAPESENNVNKSIPTAFFPHGSRSLSGISIRAFVLGAIFGAALTVTTFITILPHISVSIAVKIARSITPHWRTPFFLTALTLFHFLEFYTTAKYNTVNATASSFLLTTNGRAYNAANAGALLECFLTSVFAPTWQTRFSSSKLILGLGLGMVVTGQVVRSVAMARAGRNFNHHVQTRKNENHVLVKEGIYAYLRHPSYFGFFWWAVGTQVVVGNSICLGVYAVALWRFFRRRIESKPFFLLFIIIYAALYFLLFKIIMNDF